MGGFSSSHHHFWSDDLSLLATDENLWQHITGPKQITVVNLLALAAKHGGKFVIFDKRIL